MNIFIKQNTNYANPILYVLKIIEKNRNFQFNLVKNPEDANLIWDDENEKSQVINRDFYKHLSTNRSALKHELLFIKSPIIKDEEGNDDLIATIFYLINCIQEVEPDEDNLDKYDRFKYTASYQSKFNNMEVNLVEEYIDTFCKKNNIVGHKAKSTFFISHDIDTLYSSLLQDGFWALKNMKVGVILNLIALELIRKPHWRNIDKIIKLNNEHDIKSTFFWLVNDGIGTQNVKNADYKIKKEQDLLKLVEDSNNINGLHKSCSTMSIDEELEKGNFKNPYNRFHFINFQTQRDWKKISESKLTFDCTLGFAEHFGFRNSYGKAFQPFDFIENKPFDFVEAPLNFMDTTLHKYMKMPTKDIGNTVIDFYQKNAENCDFSLLWHNTYFTNYKYNSFIDEYKKIISFIYESKIECVTPEELIIKNKLVW